MLNQIPIRLLILFALMLFLLGCKENNDEKQIPTLTPTVASDALDKAFTNGVDPIVEESKAGEEDVLTTLPEDVAEAEAPIEDNSEPPFSEGITEEEAVAIEEGEALLPSAAAKIVLENGDTVTADPALFVMNEIFGFLHFNYPPEMSESFSFMGEEFELEYWVNRSLHIDSSTETYEGTGVVIRVYDKVQYAELSGSEVDENDPMAILEAEFIRPHNYLGVEIIEPIVPIRVNGRNGASASIHFVPFPDSPLQRSAYPTVLIDDEFIILFEGDTSLADEVAMRPVFDEMIQSFVLQDLE